MTYQNTEDYEIILNWPHHINPKRGEPIPNDIVGAEIIRIGTTRECVEGGGFVIEYKPKGARTHIRLLMALTEEGMWVERREIVRCSSAPIRGGDLG